MSDNACPVCDSPRPASRAGDEPWCCSIACYRSFHGIDGAENPSRHYGVTTTCPACQRQFRPLGRQAYCCEACRVAGDRPPTSSVLREPAGSARDHGPKPIRRPSSSKAGR